MARYRLKEGFTHYENGPPDPTPAGTIVSMSDKRYHSLRDRFELVSDDVEPVAEISLPSEDETETVSAPAADDAEDLDEWAREIASMNAKEAIATVAVIDDIDVLGALLAVEGRITVVAALEERIEDFN